MKYISSTHLANWARERDCQANFPLLIRRLINASPINITSLRIPSGDNIILPGFDGSVIVDDDFVHLPSGESVWELGTGKGYVTKANSDFNKRVAELSDKERSCLTFVFVTPYVWSDKLDWEKSRNEEKRWKEVRVIDGEQLEEWIDLLPSVGSWLTNFLQLPHAHTVPLDQFWNEWSTNEKYNLPISLILHNREKEANKVSNFFEGVSAVLGLKANTSSEAKAFVAAVIKSQQEEMAEKYFARAVIVEDVQRFRDLSYAKSPMIIVAGFNPESLSTTAAKNGHHVIVCMGNDVTISGSAILELPRIHKYGFEKGLKEMGILREESDRFIKDCGLSLTVLRRLLEFDKYNQPAWAINGAHLIMIPALLAGAWDENNEADKQLLSVLAGEPYEQYIRKLAGFKILPDAPVFQLRSIWSMTSAIDAWSVLGQYVTSIDLQNFRNSYFSALGELNPALELEVDRRYLASFFGKMPRFSHSLKEGLTETLILIAVFGESFKLNHLIAPQAFADRLVWELLDNAEGSKWCSLAEVLITLAEASPSAFLNAIEKSLKHERPPILDMFGQESADLFFSASSYYTNLLWALETLAYAEEYLLRVTLILGHLARIAPPSRMRNSPIESLHEIHIAWYQQVAADFEIRKVVLNKLMEKEPEVSWGLFLGLLPDAHGGHTSPINSCRWRFKAKTERSVAIVDVWNYYSFLFEKLLLLAGGNEQKISTLVDTYPQLNVNDRQKLVAYLISATDTTQHTNDLIWNELRTLIGRHKEHAEQKWALPEAEVKKLEEVFNLYKPASHVRNILFLFQDSWPDFPQGIKRRKMDDAQAFFKTQRVNGLKLVYKEDGLPGIFSMVAHLDDVSILASTAAELILTEQEELEMLKALTSNDVKLKTFGSRYLFSKSILAGEEFVVSAWNKFSSVGSSDEHSVLFFQSLVPRRYNWNILQQNSENIIKGYWNNVDIFINNYDEDDRAYAIKNLQNADRHFTIVHQASYFAESMPTMQLVEVLRNAATKKINEQKRLETYSVGTIFEELHKRVDLDEGELAELEWLYILFLTDSYSEKSPILLTKKLSNDVDFFIQMVSMVYSPDDGTEDGLTDEEKLERYRRADPARKLLESWRTIPGVNEKGAIDSRILKDWIEKVRTKGKSVNRSYGVDCEIGKLMAYYPRNTEYWPATEICEAIEELESETAVSHFETEIYNSRGATVRGAFEGGGQERSLASFFDKMAKLHIAKYPKVGSALARLASGYKAQGSEEDDRAHLDELR